MRHADGTRPLKARTRHLVVLCCLALVGSACGAASQSIEPTDSGPNASGGASGGNQIDDTLVVAVRNLGSMSWDPGLPSDEEEVLTQLVGDSLIEMDPDSNELVGGLAESWSASDDLTTWTFKLRPDIPFHGDYGTVTAEDVKFSWEQMSREESTQGNASALRQAVDGDMDNFEIISPLEFSVTTSTPVPYLDSVILRNPGLPIQSKAYWEANPEEAITHPHGTGPYEFVSQVPGVEVTLRALESHWRTTPVYKNLVLRIIEDEATALAQVQSGEVDMALTTPALSTEAEAAGVEVLINPEIGNVFFNMGGQFPDDPERPEAYDPDAPWIQADEPEKGLAIRQALSYAIDRKAILDSVMKGQGTLTAGPAADFPSDPSMHDPSWPLPEYDLDRAKELLAEGGYPDGFSVEFPIFALEPGHDDIQEAVATMLEELGLEVERRPYEYSVFRPFIQGRETQGMVFVWIEPRHADATRIFQNARPEANQARFYDPAVTELYPQMIRTPTLEGRNELGRQIVAELIENYRAPAMFTYDQFWVTSDKVGDWTPIPGYNKPSGLETVSP